VPWKIPLRGLPWGGAGVLASWPWGWLSVTRPTLAFSRPAPADGLCDGLQLRLHLCDIEQYCVTDGDAGACSAAAEGSLQGIAARDGWRVLLHEVAAVARPTVFATRHGAPPRRAALGLAHRRHAPFARSLLLCSHCFALTFCALLLYPRHRFCALLVSGAPPAGNRFRDSPTPPPPCRRRRRAAACPPRRAAARRPPPA
jgi:hypothetical protein